MFTSENIQYCREMRFWLKVIYNSHSIDMYMLTKQILLIEFDALFTVFIEFSGICQARGNIASYSW